MTVTSAQTNQVFKDVMREDKSGTGGPAETQALLINNGIETYAQFQNAVIVNADTVNGTTPSLIVVNYMEGVTPATARLDSLASFCRTQYAYYVSIGSGQPELGPYEAMGAAYYTEAVFIAKVNGKTQTQVFQDAYTAAFGITMSQTVSDHFAAQYTYFFGLYTGAGMSIADANMKALGAVVGQILGYSGAYTLAAGGGAQYTKAQTWLANASNGSPSYGAAL